MTAAEIYRQYENDLREAIAEAEAIIAEAVERAESRRRFHVDSQGDVVISYVDLDGTTEDAQADGNEAA